VVVTEKMSRTIFRALALLAVAVVGLTAEGRSPAFGAGTSPVTRAALDTTGASGGLGRGARITVSGGGYAPGALVVIVDHATGTVLGSAKADPTGWMAANVALDLPAGRHTIVASGGAAVGGTLELSRTVAVGTASGRLAHAGIEPAKLVMVGAALCASGVALFGTARRRRRARSAA
jgi:titin